MNNIILWTAIVSWAVAQLIKIAIELWRSKKFKPTLIISSGGMPSSHTSFVVAMSTATGILEGFNSTMFAMSTIVSFVVMYDAAGVRRAAGKQAEILNIMVENIENSGIVLDKKLKELLGHTPIEVACGALLGVIVALIAVG
jgi:acid phosphatase family membrane protein YuiD